LVFRIRKIILSSFKLNKNKTMKKSQQILIGVLGLVAVLVVLNLFGAFDGILGGGTASSEEARTELNTPQQQVVGQDNNAQNLVQPQNAQQPQQPQQAVEASGPLTTIEFEKIEHDFGTIKSGDVVDYTFKFTNTGDEPLIIKNAKGSCGCTVPQWPKEPIAPGEGGEIEVEFKSKGKSGIQAKKVTIDANVPGGKTFLTIKANVLQDETAAQPVQ
jgi:hypothetical protein